MKKYKNYLIWWAVILLWLLIYFLIPHVKFWTLQGLSYEQKDRYHIVADSLDYSDRYKLYWATIRTEEYDNWLIKRMVLDKTLVEQDREKFTDGRDRFLRDHNIEYYFKKFVEEWDRTIYEKTEQALMKSN